MSSKTEGALGRELDTSRHLQSFLTTVLGESIPRWACFNNAGPASQALRGVMIPVRAGTPCTSLSWDSCTTAASVPTNWWFALADSSYNVIRQSTDQLTTAWAASTIKTLALDSIPVTAGARVASSTVTLTFPTLSESLTSLIAVSDSVVVSNANIAAYNGTFTVVTVTATTITYVSGGSATDSLAAPFPTVQLASGKRIYTATADIAPNALFMMKATTVISLSSYNAATGTNNQTPQLCFGGDTGLTGTCPSPCGHASGLAATPWAGIS